MRRRQIAVEREALEAAGTPYMVTPMGEIIAQIEKNLDVLKPKNACPNCGKVFNRGLHLHVRACRV